MYVRCYMRALCLTAITVICAPNILMDRRKYSLLIFAWRVCMIASINAELDRYNMSTAYRNRLIARKEKIGKSIDGMFEAGYFQ